uniref:DCN1-like protein n=1 Tax=Paramormyrops kingsleyae TaxID=1676925 RepID=A0A3B3Q8Y6_9TELE|nr:DCN1-like protein 3 [Paramormyrops kingsleyae]XP_023654409.1 DCN1-like protein 3 [Paramormyrops kingsleyae]
MGQCVTKCKNPSSSLGSRNADKESGSKSHCKKSTAAVTEAGGSKEEPGSAHAKDPLANGTGKAEVWAEPGGARVALGAEQGAEAGLTLRRIEEFFERYRDEQDDAILEEGMEQLCNDLQLDPAEFRVLLLAWKFKAATMCRFTRKEFVDGCRALGADSLEGIMSRLPELQEEVRAEENFKDLYRFTFQFGLDAEQGQRSLQRDMAVALWRLVFTQDVPALLPCWLHFLTENPAGIRGVSRDTWNMFLNFTQAVGPDLSNYSEDEAWPSLFDTFVEWEAERRSRAQQHGDAAAEIP